MGTERPPGDVPEETPSTKRDRASSVTHAVNAGQVPMPGGGGLGGADAAGLLAGVAEAEAGAAPNHSAGEPVATARVAGEEVDAEAVHADDEARLREVEDAAQKPRGFSR